jgi:GT2 family glycosyltransferase/predicted SAM-dependent methyltransferase
MRSIVIPVHNQHDMTLECVTAIREHTQDCEIILVDNGSTPPLRKPFTGFMPCTVIRNEQNTGFPAAVNQGIAAAGGDVIILLNNDVTVTPGWADRLVAALQDPTGQYSIVGPVTNYCAGMQRVQLDPYKNREELDKAAEDWAEGTGEHVQDVNWIIGFCMAFPRALVDEIGPFDTSLWPCCGEEIDFCLRARAAGHRVGIATGCYVHHEGSVTFKAMEADYAAIIKRNDAHLAARWGTDVWHRQAIEPDGGGLRLNLGCGRFKVQGFLNIDQDADVQPDLVCDVLALPYEPGTVDEIYAGHLLEHFDWHDGSRALRYWHHLLKAGGTIGVAVPDFDVLAARYLQGPTIEGLRELNDLYIYSYRQKSPHKYAYSAALLAEVMTDAGFVGLGRMPIDHPYFPYPVDWQVGYQGVKPA